MKLDGQTTLPAGRAWVLSLVVLGLALLLWELAVEHWSLPPYLLPAPSRIFKTLIDDWATLAPAWAFTLKLSLAALALAAAGGVLLAVLFSLSRWVEAALLPFAIILQVTPIIAIAPLILIYVDSTFAALLICAWIVAFFPILSNTVIGLRAIDPNLRDLFELYRATRWQRLRLLLAPSALPYFLAGLKIAAGLSLIGSVAAEFVAGSAGKETGLASRMLEASFRSEVPRMFAALLLISLTGVLFFAVFNLLSRQLLARWHDSELDRR